VNSFAEPVAVPKAASLSGLRCGRDESGRWSCAVTVDV